MIVIILAVLVLVFVFRGLLWRACVSYEDIKTIPLQSLTNETLKKKLQVETENMDDEETLEYCRELTSNCLSFSMYHAEKDVNKMYPQGKTHCVGYAAFFATICEYAFLIKDREADVNHIRGRIHVFGLNVHKPFRNVPSLKDHDYVEIRLDDKTITVDPSIEDALSLE